MDEIILRNFLFSAKRSTYASNNKPKKYAKGLKVFCFSQGSFIYKDIYYGNVVDSGFEVVFENNIPIWSMSYRGGMTSSIIDSKECFKFLTVSLANIVLNFPVRGPELFVLEGYQYRNIVEGSILDFIGYEEIYFNNSKIYMKKYFGGTFKHREIINNVPFNNSIIFLSKNG